MLRDLIAKYITELKLTGRSHYTVVNYAKHLEKFATWCEGKGIDFRQINGKESRAFRNHLVEQGLAPKTVNTILGAVKSFYDFCCEEGVVKGNPIISGRLRVQEEKRRPDFLTEEDLGKVLEYLKKLPYHIGLAFRTMLSAGLRVSEVAGLRTRTRTLCAGNGCKYG